jgi:hypothetical protein
MAVESGEVDERNHVRPTNNPAMLVERNHAFSIGLVGHLSVGGRCCEGHDDSYGGKQAARHRLPTDDVLALLNVRFLIGHTVSIPLPQSMSLWPLMSTIRSRTATWTRTRLSPIQSGIRATVRADSEL